jgi:hypothetical protein
MKNEEFYSKSKSKDKIVIRPIVNKKNWWVFVTLTFLAIAIEPIILMKYRKLISLSWQDYFQQVFLIAKFLIPLEVLILWFPQVRQMAIQKKGFDWIGKFEVLDKEISLGFHYLIFISRQCAPAEGRGPYVP